MMHVMTFSVMCWPMCVYNKNQIIILCGTLFSNHYQPPSLLDAMTKTTTIRNRKYCNGYCKMSSDHVEMGAHFCLISAWPRRYIAFISSYCKQYKKQSILIHTSYIYFIKDLSLLFLLSAPSSISSVMHFSPEYECMCAYLFFLFPYTVCMIISIIIVEKMFYNLFWCASLCVLHAMQ